MDQRRAKTAAILFMAGLVLTVLAAGCGGGSSKETMDPLKGSVVSAATPTAGLESCAFCHSEKTEAWLTSKHANLDPAGNLYSLGSPTLGEIAGCASNCHDPLGDSNNLTAGYTGAAGIKRPVVGCESCHGPGSLHANGGGAGPISLVSNTTGSTWAGTSVSGQFVMCTSCHELLDTATGSVKSDPTHSAGAPAPNGQQFVITDTHFASAGTYSTNYSSLMTGDRGYSMDYASSTVCTNCHNPHGTAEINREWAASGHGDRNPDGPWSHYNWSADSRRSCQRCHTTTGFAKYADALRSANDALASAINTGSTPALGYDAAFKPEMLTCRGCHTDNTGGLRNPGKYKASYAGVSYRYPDTAASNVCMPCHTARGSGRAIHALNTGGAAAVDFGDLAYSDGHYMASGGIMFKGTPYEYAGRNYADPGTFMHKQIGTSAQPGTGANGPCVGCHMDRTGAPGNHLFQPVTDGSGVIIVTSEVCFKCHPNSSTDLGQIVDDERVDYEDGLAALEHQLDASGYTFSPSHPYFSDTDWLSAGDSDTTGNTTGKNNMGAAFNFSMLHHEPGAYIHNSRYTKRIIYDSIDWLDNNQMDYSVGSALNAFCGVDAVACVGAKRYLLYGNPGTSGERP